MEEHAVLFHGNFRNQPERNEVVHSILELEVKLKQAIADANVGEIDGYELGKNDFTIYMYGVDADDLFKAIEPVLRHSLITKDGHAIIRYGEPGATERKVGF